MTSFEEDDDAPLGLALLEELEPFLTFERVDYDHAARTASFQFHYCGGRRFRATMKIAAPPEAVAAIPRDAFHNLLVHVGLCVLPWYWMGFNCREIRVEAGFLTSKQVDFWEDFYQDVLSEFLFLHGVDRDRLKIHVMAAPDMALRPVPDRGLLREGQSPRVLVPLGGGKDSLVVYQLLADTQVPLAWVHVGDRPGEFEKSWRLQQIVKMTSHRTLKAPISFEHAMGDPVWEKQVAGNRYAPCGHPWAALVAFDSVLAAVLGGFSHIAVGNERSANFGNNVVHEGRVVNHQFDKSFAFEQRAHAYIREFLVPDVHYFSALQHLWEVQIARTFASRSLAADSFLRVFLSCNEALSGERWCCQCAKCAFVFLLLSAWCGPDEMTAIFGENLFDKPALFPVFNELLSDTAVKPMECVGTASEALLSLYLAAAHHGASEFFSTLDRELLERGRNLEFLLGDYNDQHLLPDFLQLALREPIKEFQHEPPGASAA